MKSENISRRELMKKTGQVAAVGALAGIALPQVHAGENNTIQVALVGCGGRGTGAAVNALSHAAGADQARRHGRRLSRPAQPAASAIDPARARAPRSTCRRTAASSASTAIARPWIACGPATSSSSPRRPPSAGCTSPTPSRNALNVFMEKPITVDGPSTRRMFALGEASERANLKVGVGLMCRHCAAREELRNRIKDGAIGDITLLRAYRQARPDRPLPSAGPKPANISELLYQIRDFHAFLWASGGAFSDFLHPQHRRMLLDEGRLARQGQGLRRPALSRQLRRSELRHLLRRIHLRRRHQAAPRRPDHAGLPSGIRQLRPRHARLGDHLRPTATRRPAAASSAATTSSTPTSSGAARRIEPDPYQEEWDHLMTAIRHDRPYNEVAAAPRPAWSPPWAAWPPTPASW